ncbi:MAG: hypothetical protein BKP49_04145 [Treponema sp. CETP13]|nr:MAG: hypothetical protein BKP49_04145 [Treponema sp. CETP13]
MQNSELILFIIKLVLGGIAAFLAILLWSKTRDPAWMCIIGGTVIAYAGIVVDMMTSLGMISIYGILLGGIPLLTLVFSVVPTIFYIIGFILIILRSNK